MKTMYGFEARDTSNTIGWSADAAGQQDASNTFATREAAEAELPRLAAALGCDVSDVRVRRIDPMTTTAQIRGLRAEAIDAGDLAQIVVCDRALGGTDTADDYMTPERCERDAFLHAIGLTQDEAIVECARVIADAEAQS